MQPFNDQKEGVMSIISEARGNIGYGLGREEGEAFWLLGMLQTIKVGRADTDGQFGMLEIVVPEGLGSPWHVHPEEDEWFYVLDGHLTFYVGDTRLDLSRRVRIRPQGRPAHVHWRSARPGTRPGRVLADAVRGIPARGRSAGPRPGAAAAARGSSAGHRPARADRKAKRLRNPRTPRATPRAITRPEPPPGRGRSSTLLSRPGKP